MLENLQKQSESVPTKVERLETMKRQDHGFKFYDINREKRFFSDDDAPSSSNQQQGGDDISQNSPPVTDLTERLPQGSVQELSYASSSRSTTDLYARFNKLEVLLPPGSTKCEKDVTSFIDNSVNFFCQVPEEKRGDYLVSIEDWMQKKLSEGCSEG